MKSSLDANYFRQVYAASDDPWNFSTCAYEREKYAATIELLGDRRFGNAFEIGCSIGVLTSALGDVCDELLAVDIDAKTLAIARHRNASLAHVRFEVMNVPHEFPDRAFDLIVASEVAYYWSDADLASATDSIVRTGRGGLLELVHYLPVVEDYVRTGDAVHECFLDDTRFRRIAHKCAELYRIDVLEIVG